MPVCILEQWMCGGVPDSQAISVFVNFIEGRHRRSYQVQGQGILGGSSISRE